MAPVQRVAGNNVTGGKDGGGNAGKTARPDAIALILLPHLARIKGERTIHEIRDAVVVVVVAVVDTSEML